MIVVTVVFTTAVEIVDVTVLTGAVLVVVDAGTGNLDEQKDWAGAYVERLEAIVFGRPEQGSVAETREGARVMMLQSSERGESILIEFKKADWGNGFRIKEMLYKQWRGAFQGVLVLK